MNIKVAKLNSEQAHCLTNCCCDSSGSRYNPIKDGDGDYIITEAEINATTNPETMWVKSLPLSTYIPLNTA